MISCTRTKLFMAAPLSQQLLRQTLKYHQRNALATTSNSKFYHNHHVPQSSSIAYESSLGSRDDNDDENRQTTTDPPLSPLLSPPALFISPVAINQKIQLRSYHSSSINERAVPTIAFGLGAVALTAKAGQYAVRAYDEWQKSRPPPEELNSSTSTDDKTSSSSSSSQTDGKTSSSSKGEKRENIFASWFGVGSKYYEGGFEETMTRREAALILGVRESATAKRIKDAHRKILILNHPDTGGSNYMASKINEAKELLLKGKE